MERCVVTNVFTKEVDSKKKPGTKITIQVVKLSARGYEYPYFFQIPKNDDYPELVLYAQYDVSFGFGYYLVEEPDQSGELHKVQKPSWRVVEIKPVMSNGKA